MKKIKIKILILAIILIIISIVYIIINGNTYTIKVNNVSKINNIEELNIKIENENIIKCIDKKIDNGILNIKIESKTEGKTFIDIESAEGDFNQLSCIYVHKFGIITFNEYMGDSNGSIIIPICIIILFIYILYLLIISYKQSIKINIYQYKNIAYIGIIVFLSFTMISQVLALFNYRGLINTINGILNMFSFAVVLLPIVFIVSILVILSNLSLIKKEGFNLKNILGIIMGISLCILTILPEIMYSVLYSATWIDIHNQNGIGLYIYNFIETFIYFFITYIECILIGTIIIGIKSSKHIPSFDKDFILILGCKLKKDGTLTNLLKSRADRAIEFSKMQKEQTGKEIMFIPSGGKGNDEIISEAKAIKNYLLEQEIKEENILIEDKSKNTFENIKFSNNIIKQKITNAKIAFSTTNYHVFRAGNIATQQNINMDGIGAKTKSYFAINAFIREFIATIFSEKKKHIYVICCIIIVLIFMTGLTYLNNMI